MKVRLVLLIIGALVTGASVTRPAGAALRAAKSSSVGNCERLAMRTPARLSASYVGQMLDPHQVQTVATLPNIGRRCASVGQRSFILKDIQLQQEQTLTPGFGTGAQIWKSGLAHPLTLASGDGMRRVSASATTTLQLYCYKTASKTDGVNQARAVYLLQFRPRDRSEKPMTRVLTRIVSYGLGYC